MSDLPGSASTSRSAFLRFVERRVRVLTIALPAACLVLLLPVDGWLFELLRHFRVWCAFIGFGLCAISLALRQWWWALIALFTGLWQAFPLAVDQVRPDGPPALPGTAFSILTCNLLYETKEPDAMVSSLRKADPGGRPIRHLPCQPVAVGGRGEGDGQRGI